MIGIASGPLCGFLVSLCCSELAEYMTGTLRSRSAHMQAGASEATWFHEKYDIRNFLEMTPVINCLNRKKIPDFWEIWQILRRDVFLLFSRIELRLQRALGKVQESCQMKKVDCAHALTSTESFTLDSILWKSRNNRRIQNKRYQKFKPLQDAILLTEIVYS